jgi:hypothetical protein
VEAHCTHSAAAFLFAEFAVLALGHGVHTDVWEPLLPWLVGAQAIYMKSYRTATLRYASYGKYCGSSLSDTEKETCRKPSHTPGVDLPVKVGEHAAASFADDYKHIHESILDEFTSILMLARGRP